MLKVSRMAKGRSKEGVGVMKRGYDQLHILKRFLGLQYEE